MVTNGREKLIEDLASLEHKQWSHWTKYMLDNLTPENIERWKRQIKTDYKDLSEKEKDSDREWANKVLDVRFESAKEYLVTLEKEEAQEVKEKVKCAVCKEESELIGADSKLSTLNYDWNLCGECYTELEGEIENWINNKSEEKMKHE